MNKVFISGKILDTPTLRVENGTAPHLVLALSVRHKTRSGEARWEAYRISAWNGVAQWGAANLTRGQTVAVHGYLTQRQISAGEASAITTEIAAEEFFPLRSLRAEAPPDAAEPGQSA